MENNNKTRIEKIDLFVGLIYKIFAICGLSVASIVSILLSIYTTDKDKSEPTNPPQTISPTLYNENNNESNDDEDAFQLAHTQEFLPVNSNEKYIQVKSGTICLNVRDYPNTSSNIITEIPEDETYMVLEQVQEGGEIVWYKIEIDEDTKGYIAAEFVNVLEK